MDPEPEGLLDRELIEVSQTYEGNIEGAKDKDTYIKDFNELNISRSIGNLIGVDKGIIPGPEVVESDVRMNRGKYIVMGTSSLWKYLTDDEVGDIVNKYLNSGDTLAACKELEETAKDRWKSNTGGYDDISVVVIFFDFKNFDIGK
jgi:serine/threonine protein phosphatase PrpC